MSDYPPDYDADMQEHEGLLDKVIELAKIEYAPEEIAAKNCDPTSFAYQLAKAVLNATSLELESFAFAINCVSNRGDW